MSNTSQTCSQCLFYVNKKPTRYSKGQHLGVFQIVFMFQRVFLLSLPYYCYTFMSDAVIAYNKYESCRSWVQRAMFPYSYISWKVFFYSLTVVIILFSAVLPINVSFKYTPPTPQENYIYSKCSNSNNNRCSYTCTLQCNPSSKNYDRYSKLC